MNTSLGTTSMGIDRLVINPGEKIVGLLPFAQISPQSRRVHRCQDFCLLFLRECNPPSLPESQPPHVPYSTSTGSRTARSTRLNNAANWQEPPRPLRKTASSNPKIWYAAFHSCIREAFYIFCIEWLDINQ